MSAGPRAVLLALGLASALAALPAAASGPPANMDRIRFVPPDAALPRLRWPDGSTSINDRCPVSKTRLARDILPLYVNGKPVGFC